MCIFEKASKNFGLKVDVQKGGLKFIEKKLTIDVLVPFNLHFHPLLSYGKLPSPMTLYV